MLQFLLHHENAHAYSASVVRQYREFHNQKIIAQTPYYLDLATCDDFFYSKQNFALKGHRFDCLYDVQMASQKALDMVTVKAL